MNLINGQSPENCEKLANKCTREPFIFGCMKTSKLTRHEIMRLPEGIKVKSVTIV